MKRLFPRWTILLLLLRFVSPSFPFLFLLPLPTIERIFSLVFCLSFCPPLLSFFFSVDSSERFRYFLFLLLDHVQMFGINFVNPWRWYSFRLVSPAENGVNLFHLFAICSLSSVRKVSSTDDKKKAKTKILISAGTAWITMRRKRKNVVARLH